MVTQICVGTMHHAAVEEGEKAAMHPAMEAQKQPMTLRDSLICWRPNITTFQWLPSHRWRINIALGKSADRVEV